MVALLPAPKSRPSTLPRPARQIRVTVARPPAGSASPGETDTPLAAHGEPHSGTWTDVILAGAGLLLEWRRSVNIGYKGRVAYVAHLQNGHALVERWLLGRTAAWDFAASEMAAGVWTIGGVQLE
jgi:hypothetical protein